jgi:hypothetical protein
MWDNVDVDAAAGDVIYEVERALCICMQEYPWWLEGMDIIKELAMEYDRERHS